MHTPVEVTEEALAAARAAGADCLVALGGGSTIGLAKAIALRTDLPQIAIPTTYAGSEMTPILGETKDGRKTTQKSHEGAAGSRDLRRRPDDDAAARPVGNLRHQRHRPFGRGALRGGLQPDHQRAGRAEHRRARPFAAEDRGRAAATARRVPTRNMARSWPAPAWARSAWRCTTSFATRSAACSTCRIPRPTRSCCRMRWPTMRRPFPRQWKGSPGRSASPMLRAASAALSRKVGAPQSLREIGMPESGIDEATDLALANPYWNPRPLERQGIRDLIARAWAGEEPLVQAAERFRGIPGRTGSGAFFWEEDNGIEEFRPDQPAPVHQDDRRGGNRHRHGAALCAAM